METNHEHVFFFLEDPREYLFVSAMIEYFNKTYGKKQPTGFNPMLFSEKKAEVLYAAMNGVLRLDAVKELDELYLTEVSRKEMTVMFRGEEDAIKSMERRSEMRQIQSQLDKFLDADYNPQGEDLIYLIVDAHFLARFYKFGVWIKAIPAEVIFRLDIASFKLLPILGELQGRIPAGYRRMQRIKKVSIGKQQQKGKTVDKILSAYKDIGAEWCNDEPKKKPILLKDGKKVKRCAKSKLAEAIFLHMNGSFTKDHIYNLLRELHEKGEI